VLCDFGLCTKFDPNHELHEFCGSPGFFDPEMVIKGSYYGDKADLWSLGAVFLEMILGHEAFCDIWMIAYDYDFVLDKEKFTQRIEKVLSDLPKDLASAEIPLQLQNFILSMLQIDSSDRSALIGVMKHQWLADESGSIELEVTATLPHTISSLTLTDLAVSDQAGQIASYENSMARGVLLQNSMSQRERNHLQLHMGTTFSLPPLEPATPTTAKARKILSVSPRKSCEAEF